MLKSSVIFKVNDIELGNTIYILGNPYIMTFGRGNHNGLSFCNRFYIEGELEKEME